MFVTFKDLGNYGQLGNQLFQIASTIGIAISNEQHYVFPRWKYSKFFKKEIPQSDKIDAHTMLYKEKSFKYSNIVLDRHYDWNLFGYFQSEKYFRHCEQLIRSYFEPKSEISEYLFSKYEDILRGNVCSIHVRRHDIPGGTTSRATLVCPIQYYDIAIQEFPHSLFLVFSNDIKWCEKHFKGNRFVFVEGQSNIEDLFLMSMCKNNIICNSSFSWWAAWLNPNPEKIVIAPNLWFGWALGDLNTDSLILKQWKQVDISDFAFTPEQKFMKNVVQMNIPLVPRFLTFVLRKERMKKLSGDDK